MPPKTFEVRYFERDHDGSLFTSDIVEMQEVESDTPTSIFLAWVCNKLEYDACEHGNHELRVNTEDGVDVLSLATVGLIEGSRLKAYAGAPHELETRLKSAERRSSILKASPLALGAGEVGEMGEVGGEQGEDVDVEGAGRDLDAELREAAESGAAFAAAAGQGAALESKGSKGGASNRPPSPERAGGVESPGQVPSTSSSSSSPSSSSSRSSSQRAATQPSRPPHSRAKEPISASDMLSAAVLVVICVLLIPSGWVSGLVGVVRWLR